MVLGFSGLPIERLDLHLDPLVDASDLYAEIRQLPISRKETGTQIWEALSRTRQRLCLKEFLRSEPSLIERQRPDPGWVSATSQTGILHSEERGLSGLRGRLFEQLVHGDLKQQIARYGTEVAPGFLEVFNAYSFETEALITQAAARFGYKKIVQSSRWGSFQFPGRAGARYAIEMERLEDLPPPPIGDPFGIVHRLVQMMAAVSQLHSLLLPIYAYPPELTPDLRSARKTPWTRPFHYDLSPDQFLLRPASASSPFPEIVLIDFNSTRMDQAEYSSFSWSTILGKDYYQPPERRTVASPGHSFLSNPVIDLYSLLVIGLYYLFRHDEKHTKIRFLRNWGDLATFYRFLQDPHLPKRLAEAPTLFRGLDPSPLFSLMAAAFRGEPLERVQALSSLSPLGWRGLHDWTLVPRSMDLLARKTLGRSFTVAWKKKLLVTDEGQAPQPLADLLDWKACQFSPGLHEYGRIEILPFAPDALFFFQEETRHPHVFQGVLWPGKTGSVKIYASFFGCIDWQNPLTVEVRPAASTLFGQAAESTLSQVRSKLVAASTPQNQTRAKLAATATSQHQGIAALVDLAAQKGRSTPAPYEDATLLDERRTPTPSFQASPKRPPAGTQAFQRETTLPDFGRQDPLPIASQASELASNGLLQDDTFVEIGPIFRRLQHCKSDREIEDLEFRYLGAFQGREDVLFRSSASLARLLLERKGLLPSLSLLRSLSVLIWESGDSPYLQGVLLNNLAICFFQQVFRFQNRRIAATDPAFLEWQMLQTRRFVHDDLFGFDLLKTLAQWIETYQEDPLPRLQPLVERLRETLHHSALIMAKVSP